MYSKEEIQIMNLDDNYTLLYPFLVKSLIEHFGEQERKQPGREPGGLEGTERNAPQQTLERRSQDQYAQPDLQ